MVINLSLFFHAIERKYWRTFYDPCTGKEYAVVKFHAAETDEAKFDVFAYHRSFYENIEDELKTWLEAEWQNWEDAKPEWFDARAKRSVPKDMLPAAVLQKMNENEAQHPV